MLITDTWQIKKWWLNNNEGGLLDTCVFHSYNVLPWTFNLTIYPCFFFFLMLFLREYSWSECRGKIAKQNMQSEWEGYGSDVACPYPHTPTHPPRGQQEESKSRERKCCYLFYQWKEEDNPPAGRHQPKTHTHSRTQSTVKRIAIHLTLRV